MRLSSLRLVAVVLLLIPLLPPSGHAQEMPEAARGLMVEADRAREENRVSDAIEKYRHVIQVAPNVTSAYVNLGALLFKQGNVTEAHAIFLRGMSIAPADRALLTNAAATALQLGKPEDALRFADQAITRNQKDASLHSLRSTILRALHRDEEALAAITTAATLAPDDPKYQFSRGNLLAGLGRQEQAIDAFRKTTALDPSFVNAWFNLGAIYLRQQKSPEAIDAYQKAATLDHGSEAHYNLGFLYYNSGKFDAARDEYQKALSRSPALPLAYLHLGTIAFRAAKYDDALRLLQDGLPYFDPESKHLALPMIGRSHLMRGDPASARASLEAALASSPADAELLLLLARLARHEHRLDDAKSLLDRAEAACAPTPVALIERVLVARAINDVRSERAALQSLPDRPPLRAELAEVSLRENPTVANLRALHLTDRDVTATLDALDGNQLAAAKTLAQSNSPLANGDAGLLFWQLGRNDDAKPLLTSARKAIPEWSELALAAGEIAMSERKYDAAAETLATVRCGIDEVAEERRAETGAVLHLVLGTPADACGRAKRSLAGALLGQAADSLDRAVRTRDENAARRVRQLADRIATLDEQRQTLASFLRGTADLATGADASARENLTRALEGDLPPAVAAMAKKNLEAAQPVKDPALPNDVHESRPRRTVVVFLPDTPAETEKKLAESVNALINGLSIVSAIPLKMELFRRAADARAFITANHDQVGVVIANPEFIAREFAPRYTFSRNGRTTYLRKVVVPAASAARSLSDLRGHSITGCEGAGDDGVAITTFVADDRTALANALYGRTDAALVSEANPLLAERAADLRVVHVTAPQPLPVVAFAPMPASDRTAIDSAFRTLSGEPLAAMRFSDIVPISVESRVPLRREILTPAAALLTTKRERPPAMPLRVAVTLPPIDIPEDLFGPP